jgi:hypothetical protein
MKIRAIENGGQKYLHADDVFFMQEQIKVEKPATIKLKEEIIEKIKNLKLDEQLNAEGARLLILECIDE